MLVAAFEDKYTHLKAIIFASALEKEEKQLWYSLLPALEKTGTTTAVISLVTEAPSALEMLTDNLRKKAAAIASGDVGAFRSVILEEETYISQF